MVSDGISPKGLTARQSLRTYEIFKKPVSTTFYFPEIIIVVRSLCEPGAEDHIICKKSTLP